MNRSASNLPPTLAARLRARWSRMQFCPAPWEIVFNPYYVIRRGLYRAIRDHAALARGRILDFGAGSSPYRQLFHCDEYVPVDLESSGHPADRKKATVYYDGRTLPFQDERFDFILCSEVLEHVFNLDEILSELNRVLRHGGTLLITVPFAWEEHEQPYDFARYTSFGLRHVLENHGFEVESIGKTTGYLETVFQLFVSYLTGRRVFRIKILKLFASPLLFAPILLVGIALNAICPNDGTLYHNNVVVVRRR